MKVIVEILDGDPVRVLIDGKPVDFQIQYLPKEPIPEWDDSQQNSLEDWY